jgi:hypothetical protein
MATALQTAQRTQIGLAPRVAWGEVKKGKGNCAVKHFLARNKA